MSLLLQCCQLGNTAGTRPLFTRVDLSINTKHGIEASQSRVHWQCTGTHTLNDKDTPMVKCLPLWKLPQLSSVAGSLTRVMTTMPAINSIGIARIDSFSPSSNAMLPIRKGPRTAEDLPTIL